MDKYRYIEEQYCNCIGLWRKVLFQIYSDLLSLNYLVRYNSMVAKVINILYTSVDFLNSKELTLLCEILNVNEEIFRKNIFKLIIKKYEEAKKDTREKNYKGKQRLLKAYELVINNYENGK